MNYKRGKIHKKGPEIGYDTTMCNSFYVPVYYSRGVSDNWKDVDCKSCIRARKRKAVNP